VSLFAVFGFVCCCLFIRCCPSHSPATETGDRALRERTARGERCIPAQCSAVVCSHTCARGLRRCWCPPPLRSGRLHLALETRPVHQYACGCILCILYVLCVLAAVLSHGWDHSFALPAAALRVLSLSLSLSLSLQSSHVSLVHSVDYVNEKKDALWPVSIVAQAGDRSHLEWVHSSKKTAKRRPQYGKPLHVSELGNLDAFASLTGRMLLVCLSVDSCLVYTLTASLSLSHCTRTLPHSLTHIRT
jgi:hypothetical protein